MLILVCVASISGRELRRIIVMQVLRVHIHSVVRAPKQHWTVRPAIGCLTPQKRGSAAAA
jgi:hypothetical protein